MHTPDDPTPTAKRRQTSTHPGTISATQTCSTAINTWTQLPVGHLAHFVYVFFHGQSLSCPVPNLNRPGGATRSLSESVYKFCPVSKVDRPGGATRSLSVSVYTFCPVSKVDRPGSATRSLSVSVYKFCPVLKVDRRVCATRPLSVSIDHICPVPKLDRRG